MADIEFNCPKCGKHLSVDGKGAGLEVPCPECSRMIQVPDAMSVEGKPKTKPSGRIFNITILLSALVLAGGLVGSAYLLSQGMTESARLLSEGMNDLGRYSSRERTIKIRGTGYGGEIRVGGIDMPSDITLRSGFKSGYFYLDHNNN